jgi:hypothetical protein
MDEQSQANEQPEYFRETADASILLFFQPWIQEYEYWTISFVLEIVL